jgi:protease IV
VSSRRGIFLVLLLIFLGTLASIAGWIFLSLFAAAPPPSVPANATLYLPIQAPFSELETNDVLSQFVRRPPTLRQTIEAIRKAKIDSRVKTLVITPQASGALWGQLQEVRGAIEDFKTSGKPVTAYLEAGGAQEYYLASAADRIAMMPAGQLDLVGLTTYELFFRGTLDKIGVYPDLLHIGDYKTASNNFTEKTFTPAHREMYQSLNHDWYSELVRAIAAGRKRSEDDVRRLLDDGPYLATGALKAGLVDALSYEDQLDDAAPVAGTRRIDGETYARVPRPVTERVSGARIAVLYAIGTIASGRSSFDGPGGNVLGSETFVEWVRKVRVDPTVRAIVVRIDSPGGSAIASEVIWRELMLARDIKPVVVSMGDVAASGGYYMAVPAHSIVAQPGTITGSIGVVTGKIVLKGTLDKIGVGAEAVSEGRFADIYSPFKPFSSEERARIAEQMRATYDLFVSRVAEGRQQQAARIDQLAQGRVWTGRQAHERGLVDELGGLDRAIQIAKEKARLDAKKDVDLLIYPPRRSLYDILSNPFGASVRTGLELFFRRPDARAVETALTTLNRFRRGEPLFLMPNVFWR